MDTLILVIHVLLAITVIVLVLLQQGKGADAGATFGGGASGTLFGARGAGSFMTRMTTLSASLFFCTSIALFYVAANRGEQVEKSTSVMSEEVVESAPSTPSDVPVIEGGSSNVSDIPAVPNDADNTQETGQ